MYLFQRVADRRARLVATYKSDVCASNSRDDNSRDEREVVVTTARSIANAPRMKLEIAPSSVRIGMKILGIGSSRGLFIETPAAANTAVVQPRRIRETRRERSLSDFVNLSSATWRRIVGMIAIGR